MRVLLCAALLSLVPGALEPRRDQDAPFSEAARLPIERLRERLQGRPREERLRLERNLSEFERLPPAARLRLLERARTLRAQEHAFEARERAPEPAEEQLGPEGLREQQHLEQQRAQLREGFRARGRELRSRLPPEVRVRLEQAPPEERRAMLERFVQRCEHASLRALAGMREAFGLSDEQFQRLERMPLADRLAILRELARRSRHEGKGPGRRPR